MDRVELMAWAARGSTLSEIAQGLGVSVSTVRYWLEKHDLEALRRASRGAAVHGGQKHIELVCRVHGLTRHVLREDARCYRCLRCRGEAVARRRRRVKAQLVAEAGGRCALCGYDRCDAALQFHHLEPAQKAFGLSRRGVTRSLESARREAEKCVLLCSNCHAEVEVGFAAVPTDVAA